jgi:hypothetical protein
MDEIKILDNEFPATQILRCELVKLLGKPCSSKSVGEYRSLTLGFGEQIKKSSTRSGVSICSEWELGTYNSAWRIISNGRILCGNMTPVDTNQELDDELAKIALGKIVDIKMLSMFDVRLDLDNEISIDFLSVANYEGESFFVFGPSHLYIQYHYCDGWRIGKSNEPWR